MTGPSSGCSRTSAMRRSVSGCAVCADDDDMSAVPLILVVGGDALALRVCEELLATEGHRVALLWTHDVELAARLDRLGCGFFPHQPNDYEALRLAGVTEAASVMALSDD